MLWFVMKFILSYLINGSFLLILTLSLGGTGRLRFQASILPHILFNRMCLCSKCHYKSYFILVAMHHSGCVPLFQVFTVTILLLFLSSTEQTKCFRKIISHKFRVTLQYQRVPIGKKIAFRKKFEAYMRMMIPWSFIKKYKTNILQF